MIISIHIPKTAGTSFRLGLAQSGINLALLYYNAFEEPCLIGYNYELGDLASKRSPYTMQTALDKARRENVDVIHGHFTFAQVSPFLIPEDKLITWVRNPIKRAISEWAHFAAIRKEKSPANPMKNPVQARGFFESTANRHTQYMDGGLNRLKFIGRQENYEEDLFNLEKFLGLKVPLLRENKSSIQVVTSRQLIDLVSIYNELDMDIYMRIADATASM